MRVRCIHVLRKPLTEPNVASNVLKYGCGGLNIDATRIPGIPGIPGSSNIANTASPVYGKSWNDTASRRALAYRASPPSGRWPANLILEHLPGCTQKGFKQVRGSHDTAGVWGAEDTSQAYSNKSWYDQDHLRSGYTSPDGTETVPAWDCQTGCPVKELDEQVGIKASGKLEPHHRRHQPRLSSDRCYGDDQGDPQSASVGRTFGGDMGMVSRFFKQVSKGAS